MSERPEGLSHVGASGEARMVDVSAKDVTERMARAAGTITMLSTTLDAIVRNGVKKGDVLSVARVAGIMAAKRTSDLVPLCHPLPISDVQLDIAADDSLPGLRVEACVRCISRTGVEMEAITAVAVTLITIYDMAKSLDKGMVISDICLVEKAGGRSGNWQRP